MPQSWSLPWFTKIISTKLTSKLGCQPPHQWSEVSSVLDWVLVGQGKPCRQHLPVSGAHPPCGVNFSLKPLNAKLEKCIPWALLESVVAIPCCRVGSRTRLLIFSKPYLKTYVAWDRVEVSGPDSAVFKWAIFRRGLIATFEPPLGSLFHLFEVSAWSLSPLLSSFLLRSHSHAHPLIFQILCPGFPSPGSSPPESSVLLLTSSILYCMAHSHFLRELSLTPALICYWSSNMFPLAVLITGCEIIFVLWIFLRLDMSTDSLAHSRYSIMSNELYLFLAFCFILALYNDNVVIGFRWTAKWISHAYGVSIFPKFTPPSQAVVFDRVEFLLCMWVLVSHPFFKQSSVFMLISNSLTYTPIFPHSATISSRTDFQCLKFRQHISRCLEQLSPTAM